MIKTTLRTLVNSADAPKGRVSALDILAAQPLPARASFRLGKIVNAVSDEVKAYHASRLAACERYGTLNKQTEEYDIPPEKRPAFEAEIKELQDSEVEIAGDPVPLSLIEGANVPAAVMAALNWLVVDDAPAQAAEA